MRRWRLALPLHPEYRTLPMVWYIPPLSPMNAGTEDSADTDEALKSMRIPLRYLANLLTAGDEAPLRRVLGQLLAMRAFMRSIRLEGTPDRNVLDRNGLDEATARQMYELLALAKHEDRFVIPTAGISETEDLLTVQGGKGLE
jgi:nitrate reductase beta subunit